MKILIATGGSGGHIYPALSVARKLRDQGHHVVFAGVFKKWLSDIQEENFDTFELPAKGWKANSLKGTLTSAVSMLQSFYVALKVLKQVAPDRVLGFGGYGSFPVVSAGVFKKIPTAVHEQNVIPGRANKLLGKFVEKVLVSFPESTRYFPKKKVRATGYPVRPFVRKFSRQEILSEFGFSDQPTCVLIGGSQGSRALNHVMIKAAALLQKHLDFQIIHLAGEADVDIVRMGYQQLGVTHQAFSFFKQMEKIYTVADVMVCRAGAGVIHETAYFNVPAVVIPYPYAGAHQKYNAAAFVRKGKGVMIEEQHLTPERLSAEVLNMLTQREATRNLKKSDMIRDDAVDEIIRVLIKEE